MSVKAEAKRMTLLLALTVFAYIHSFSRHDKEA